jgi:tRNA A-37 threonylcarbamoyl transferase component Bud32
MDRVGKYIVLEEIGQGGMGIVYKARDPIIGREVAVKVIIERIMRAPDLKERFLREIASAGRLSHENIMTIYDAGDHEGRPYFVMELLSGTDLSTVIRRGTLSLDEKLVVAQEVARGLRYAHERGVIHRDIKPDNVRVLDSGRAKIMDFGIARVESATRPPTHSSIGTPRYMSPEQIKGEHVDRRTDIFSFGALFYELLTGTPPFSGERITTVIYKILHETPQPVDLGTVPGAAALSRIVERCLAKNLEDRYARFDDVLGDLDAVAAERHPVMPTATALPPESVERAEERAEADETRVIALTRAMTQPRAPSDETVIEPLKGRPRATPDSTRPGWKLPVRALALGGGALLAVLGLTYVIAQPGGEPGARESEAVVATADSPAARPFVPPLEPDSMASDAALPVDELAGEPADAASAGSEGDEALAGARRQAEGRRSQVRTAKARAAQADGHPLYDRALVQERSGDTAFRRGTAEGYAAAQTAYAEAVRLFGQAQAAAHQAAAEQASAEQAAAQAAAEQAQQAMNDARANILDRRTDSRIAADFQRAETHRATAERRLRDGDFDGAAASFGEARTIYAAAARTAAQPPPERDPEPAPAGPLPEERAQAAAEQAAGAAAARLKQALEQESAAAMRAVHSFYDGWDGFFRIADNVRATVSVQSVEASGTSATAAVSLRIQFRNTSKNEDETTSIRYGWTLEQHGDAWALTSVAVR